MLTRNKRWKRGFTLTEMLVVFVSVLTLSAVGTGAVLGMRAIGEKVAGVVSVAATAIAEIDDACWEQQQIREWMACVATVRADAAGSDNSAYVAAVNAAWFEYLARRENDGRFSAANWIHVRLVMRTPDQIIERCEAEHWRLPRD